MANLYHVLVTYKDGKKDSFSHYSPEKIINNYNSDIIRIDIYNGREKVFTSERDKK